MTIEELRDQRDKDTDTTGDLFEGVDTGLNMIVQDAEMEPVDFEAGEPDPNQIDLFKE